MNIINTGVGNRVQRKSKQKFIALIEELEKNRRWLWKNKYFMEKII